MNVRGLLPWLILITATLGGCAAVKTFSLAARPGDTVALAAGWNQKVNRNNLTVQFTDANGAIVTYAPGSAGIRTVAQLYPDPVSKLVVEYATGQSAGVGLSNGVTIGENIDSIQTNYDADWNQTVVYLDLPSSLAVGMTDIVLSGPSGVLTESPIQVDILPGSGTRNNFATQGGGTASSSLSLLQRRSYYTITFSGSAIPDAIQVDLTRPVGTAKPWVINTRGDLKNVTWHDDGATNLRVMLAPSHGVPLTDMKHYKFYVASGIPLAGLLTVSSVVAYDASGNLIPGVQAEASYTP